MNMSQENMIKSNVWKLHYTAECLASQVLIFTHCPSAKKKLLNTHTHTHVSTEDLGKSCAHEDTQTGCPTSNEGFCVSQRGTLSLPFKCTINVAHYFLDAYNLFEYLCILNYATMPTLTNHGQSTVWFYFVGCWRKCVCWLLHTQTRMQSCMYADTIHTA